MMFRRKGKAKQEICDAIEFGLSADNQLVLMTFKRDGAAVNRAVVNIGTFAEMPPAMMKVFDACAASAEAKSRPVR
jgi:hypothetical protein